MKNNIKETIGKEPLGLAKSFQMILYALKFIVIFPFRIIAHLISISIIPIISLIVPVLMGQIFIDNILLNNPLDPSLFHKNYLLELVYGLLGGLSSQDLIFYVLLLVLVFKILSCSIDVFSRWWEINLGNRMIQKIRTETCKKIIDLKSNLQYSDNAGNLIYRNQIDPNSICVIYKYMVTQTWSQFYMFFITFYLMWTINKELTLISLITAPLIIFLNFYYSFILRKYARKEKEWSSGLMSKINEIFSFSREIYINNKRDEEFKDYEEKSQRSLLYNLRRIVINLVFENFNGIISTIIMILFMYCSIDFVWNKTLTIGQWTLLNSYFLTINAISLAISRLWLGLQAHVVSISRIKQLLDKKINIENHIYDIKEKDVEKIEIKNICLSYDNNKILNNINLTFKKGNIYFIMGPVGSGKTSLLNCISKIYNQTSGNIYINDLDISNIDSTDKINYLLQDIQLFPTTILDNIFYGNNGYSFTQKYEDISLELKDKVKYLSEKVGLEFINEFPDKYDTKIEENSINLSIGQKQKILIARLLNNGKKILLLDEPFSFLDSESKSNVLEELNKIKEDKIIIIVSHEKITENNIVFLENGKINNIHEILEN